MKITLLVIQSIAALGLIITVLLHSAKGDGLGGIGGQAHMFRASKGLEAGLNKATTGFAVLFMALAVVLGVFLS